MTPYLSFLLRYGFGNQIGDVCTLLAWGARHPETPVYLRYWATDLFTELATPSYTLPWAGHACSKPLSLFDIFPKLQRIQHTDDIGKPWTHSTEDGVRVGNVLLPPSSQRQIGHGKIDEFVEYEIVNNEPTVVIDPNSLNCKFWHEHREMLIDTFDVADRIRTETIDQHPYLKNEHVISMHIRLGLPNDVGANPRGLISPTPNYYLHMAEKASDYFPNAKRVLLFVDNLAKAQPFIEQIKTQAPLPVTVSTSTDPWTVFDAMKMCRYHILAASSLSFWAAYLSKSETVWVHPAFYWSYTRKMIPNDLLQTTWHEYPDDKVFLVQP